MKNIYLVSSVVAVLGISGWLPPAAAAPPEIVSAQEASHVVTVRDVQARGGMVSGVVINNSPDAVRDVQLLIQQPWFWKNEFHPGSDNPGRARFHTVAAEIPPGGRVPFTYQAGPLPQRADGHFETFVKVSGFTEVGTGTASAGGGTHALSR